MAINFLNSIDLNKNQLISARIENLNGNPSEANSSEGQIYFNTSSNELRVYAGNGANPEVFAWEAVGGDITLTGDVTGGPGSPTIATTISALAVATSMIQDSAVETAKINDGAVLSAKIGQGEVATGNIAASAVTTAKIAASAVSSAKIANAAVGTDKIADGNVTTIKIDNGAISTAKIANGAVSFTKIAGADVVTSTENFTSIASDTNIATSKAIKEYVDLVATGSLTFIGGINALTGTPSSGVESGNNLYNPSTPIASRTYGFDVSQDEFFVITTAGNWLGISTLPVTVGDSVICIAGVGIGDPVLSTEWTIVQADRDLATISTVGIGNVNKANESMVVSYSNGTAQVKVNSANFTVVGNASQTAFNFTNTLGSNDGIIATVTEISTGEVCFPSVRFHTVSSVFTLTVTFAVAPVQSKRYSIALMRVA